MSKSILATLFGGIRDMNPSEPSVNCLVKIVVLLTGLSIQHVQMN